MKRSLLDKSIKLFFTLMLVGVFASCVSTKKYNALTAKCNEESTALNAKVDELSTKVNELSSENSRYKKDVTQLKADTSRLGSMLRVLTADYNELDRSNELLKSQFSANFEDAEKVMAELKATKDNLIAREDRLNALQAELDIKGKNLADLQAAMHKKDSITDALRRAVADALTGFEGKGLTVHIKDGKVYVSLEEKLLFASGKWDVSNDGVTALKDLAKVLEKNPDINVLIEGHTDNVPLTGQNQVKDNWDLSAMRATSIVKILLANGKISPKRLVASGRGEFLPVEPNTSPSNKAKNRRTEIILSPKLDELMQIIGTN
ncbi:MAG: OmpA family protein [Bacteroidales bacterium]